MSQARFQTIMGEIAGEISGLPLDAGLAERLNQCWPKDGDIFHELAELCAEGEREGWLLQREAGGIKFGRAVKPGESSAEFSVDVVRMKNVRGPHHIHPNGEIGAVLPIEGAPVFDAFEPGWYVYGPGSRHNPTITGGDAYVIYLLPEGAIEFTGQ